MGDKALPGVDAIRGELDLDVEGAEARRIEGDRRDLVAGREQGKVDQVIVTGIEVCILSGELSTPDCPETRFENYLAGTEPTRNCPIHGDGAVGNKGFLPNIFGNPSPGENTPVPVKKKMITVRICTESGLVATPFCPVTQVVTEVFTIGDEPTLPCNVHKK